MKKIKVYFLSIFMLLVSICAIYTIMMLYEKHKAYRIAQVVIFNKNSLNAAKIINETWREGDYNKTWISGKLRCPQLGNSTFINTEYTRCNSVYLKCYLEQIFNQNKIYQLKAEVFLEQLSSIVVNISSPNNSSIFQFKLENNCHEAFLPMNNYGHAIGIKNEKILKWRFDLYNRNIFIDKFLVSNYEVNRWINIKKYNYIKKEEVSQLALPATSLNKDQMKQFCMDHQKQLVPAHILDAATIYPQRNKEKKIKMSMLYPFPWTRNSKNIFVQRIRKGEKVDLTMKMCRRIYTKDCSQKFKYISYDTHSSSWIGIYQVMGGFSEYTPNILDSKKIVRLSTSNISSKSGLHKLGKRGPWKNGANNIGFRCMKEVSVE